MKGNKGKQGRVGLRHLLQLPSCSPFLKPETLVPLKQPTGPKTHWGMHLLDKIMILQGIKLTIQPLGVGYANRPKKAKMGGYVAFSPIYACLALI